MNPRDQAIEYRRLRAPRQHGAILADPPLEAAAAALQANRRQAQQAAPCPVQGKTLGDLAREARRELIALALQHTSQYTDVPAMFGPLILTGHQPQLFHPGVWFKNFVVARLARDHGATAVNLLIDNDTLRSPTIKVPTGSASEPRVEVLAMDRQRDEVPFEERAIHEPRQFAEFGRRVAQCVAPLVPDPLVREVWPRAVEAARHVTRLGLCLARARHQLEQAWGSSSLEVPLSQVVDAPAFRHLTAHLLAQLPRFRDTYNGALREFRRVNRVRSRTHPVADLAMEGDWLEAPFWLWTSTQPLRRKLFVRRIGQQLELTDRQDTSITLDLDVDSDASVAVEQLSQHARQGVKVRPRALITTLFARLLACDLFIHGIGGAKYDQVTDAIVRRFFGIEPPRFMTVTLTAQLPVPHPVVTREAVRQANAWLRDIRYHGERFLSGDLADVPPSANMAREPVSPDVHALIDEKRRWLTMPSTAGSGRERHQALERINATLAAHLALRRQTIRAYRDEQAVLAARHALLASREYSFCLFPEDALRPLLT